MTTPAHTLTTEQQLGRWMVAAIAGLTVLAVLLFARNAVSDLRRPAPFAYSKTLYYPLTSPVCPGDTLRWRSEFTVNVAPVALRVTRNLYDVDEQKIVTFDAAPGWITWMREDIGKSFTFEGSYPLPKTLDPGMYELRTAAGSNVSSVDAYRVPFVIAEDCFKKDVKK